MGQLKQSSHRAKASRPPDRPPNHGKMTNTVNIGTYPGQRTGFPRANTSKPTH